MIIRWLIIFLLISVTAISAEPRITPGSKTLPLAGEAFQIDGHDAFVILPPDARDDIPWVWYRATLSGLPAQSEVWMFERLLAQGVAIAGIDVGESFGSPDGTKLYTAFYGYLVSKRQFREKPCLLARSRGGLMLYNWAVEHPQSVAGVVGIYPVCNIVSYPGVARAASVYYGLTAEQLEVELTNTTRSIGSNRWLKLACRCFTFTETATPSYPSKPTLRNWQSVIASSADRSRSKLSKAKATTCGMAGSSHRS